MNTEQTKKALKGNLERLTDTLQMTDVLDRDGLEQNLKEFVKAYGHNGAAQWSIANVVAMLQFKKLHEYSREILLKMAVWSAEAKAHYPASSQEVRGFEIFEEVSADAWLTSFTAHKPRDNEERRREAEALSAYALPPSYHGMFERITKASSSDRPVFAKKYD